MDKEAMADLLRQYHEAAARTSDPNPKAANKWADKVFKLRDLLRETEEGRNGITSMIWDPDRHVQLWAASQSLEWTPEKARPALEHLKNSHGPCSFSAEMTLIEYDKGNLHFGHGPHETGMQGPHPK